MAWVAGVGPARGFCPGTGSTHSRLPGPDGPDVLKQLQQDQRRPRELSTLPKRSSRPRWPSTTSKVQNAQESLPQVVTTSKVQNAQESRPHWLIVQNADLLGLERRGEEGQVREGDVRGVCDLEGVRAHLPPDTHRLLLVEGVQRETWKSAESGSQ